VTGVARRRSESSALALLTNRVLQGEFYYLLRRAGAGPKLARTGTNEQAGIGYIRSMKTVMAFALMPVIVAGQTIYVPVRPST